MTTKRVDIGNLKKEIICMMDTGYDADKKICIEILNCIDRNIQQDRSMTPHPQRCETCTHFDCEYASKPSRSRHMAQGFFIKKGCASHSSAASERDMVLDYLDEWVNTGDNLALFKWELREVLRALRQKAGE